MKTNSKSKPKTPNKTKSQNDFPSKKSQKIYQELVKSNKPQNKKYFGYLNKNTMATILIVILFLVALGDIILINSYFHK